MERTVRVILYESNIKYNLLKELEVYLNAYRIKNNGVLIVWCNKLEYVRILRLRIRNILKVKDSQIYLKYKH